MVLSSRMQNLAKQGLRRNPSMSRDSFHGVVAQMMGKKGITDSVKKTLKATGHYYGSKQLKKREYEKAVRDVSEHLQEKGVKETRFVKDIRKSLTRKQGLAKGSVAEKIFENDIENQINAGEPTGIDNSIRNRLRTKLMQGQKLTKRDLEGVPEEELDKLKNMIGALKQIHKREMAEQIEKEAKEQTDEGKMYEKAKTSASAREDNQGENQDSQSVETDPAKSQSTVPLQGGVGAGAGMERKENLERFTDFNFNQGSSGESEVKQKSSELPSVEEKTTNFEDGEDGPSDMEIG